jgi:hypothetical protein
MRMKTKCVCQYYVNALSSIKIKLTLNFTWPRG